MIHSVLLLGAGHGRRMGGPKLFTEHRGRSFTERILARCAESASPVTLTVDPVYRTRLEVLLTGLATRMALPPLRLVAADGNLDMLRSVQAGLAAKAAFPGAEGVPTDWTNGFWLWPVDAPFLSSEGWQHARQAAASQPDAVLKLRTGEGAAGKTGHPIHFPAWAVAPILAGDWPDGLLGFLKEVPPGRMAALPLPGEVLRDLDTPEALAEVAALVD